MAWPRSKRSNKSSPKSYKTGYNDVMDEFYDKASDGSLVDLVDAFRNEVRFGPRHGDSFEITSRQQRKIVITLTFSKLIAHPFNLLNNRFAVLKFQRSLRDSSAPSDGFWRSLPVPQFIDVYSPLSWTFCKDVVVSIYQRHGLVGFFRGVGESALHHLLRDFLNYLVPVYALPSLEKLYNKLADKLNDIALVNKLPPVSPRVKSAYSSIQYVLCGDRQSQLLCKLISELLTYPVLTWATRVMVYDGADQLSSVDILKQLVLVEGFPALYRGIVCRLLGVWVTHIETEYSSIHKHKLIAKDSSGEFKHTIAAELTTLGLQVCNATLTQLSLVRRCGSAQAGFCVLEPHSAVVCKMPWVLIGAQFAVAASLIYARELLTRDVVGV